jgi:hypothetical protein
VERLTAHQAPREAVAELLEGAGREHDRKGAVMLERERLGRGVSGFGQWQATTHGRGDLDHALSFAHRQDAAVHARRDRQLRFRRTKQLR